MIFLVWLGPPKELDADELAFLNKIEQEEREKEHKERLETQKALDEFKVCTTFYISINSIISFILILRNNKWKVL